MLGFFFICFLWKIKNELCMLKMHAICERQHASFQISFQMLILWIVIDVNNWLPVRHREAFNLNVTTQDETGKYTWSHFCTILIALNWLLNTHILFAEVATDVLLPLKMLVSEPWGVNILSIISKPREVIKHFFFQGSNWISHAS